MPGPFFGADGLLEVLAQGGVEGHRFRGGTRLAGYDIERVAQRDLRGHLEHLGRDRAIQYQELEAIGGGADDLSQHLGGQAAAAHAQQDDVGDL